MICRVGALIIAAAGCGPSTVVSDGGGSSGSPPSTDDTAADAHDPGEADTDGDETSTTDATTESEPSPDGSTTADSDESGVGDDPFPRETVLGGWVCDFEAGRFTMHLDEVLDGGDQIYGRACLPHNDARDPNAWEPCGELSTHPVAGDPRSVWPYIQIPASPDGPGMTASPALFYDVLTDTMEGNFSSPGNPSRGPVACARIP